MWLEIGAVAGMVLSMWLLALEGGNRFRDRSVQVRKPKRLARRASKAAKKKSA